MKYFLLFAVAFSFFTESQACNFCMLGQGISPYLVSNGKGVTFDANYVESNKVYNHSKDVDSLGKKEGWLTYTLTGFYSLTDDLTILASVPYAMKSNIDHDSSSGLNPGVMVNGLSDIRINGRYTVLRYHTLESTFIAGTIFGIKVPTGGTDYTDNSGAPVDRHALPGTGSVDYNLGGTFNYALASGYMVSGDLTYAYSGKGRWGGRSHQFGDSVNYSLKAYYRVNQSDPSVSAQSTVFLFTGISGHWTGKEKGRSGNSGYASDAVNPSTGGTTLFGDIGVYSPLSQFAIVSAAFSKSIYRDMNFQDGVDADPAEDYKVNMSITYLF